MTLGLDNLEGVRLMKPQSLFAIDDLLYVADTGNNRIIELKRNGIEFTVRRVIREMTGAAVNTINQP